MTIQSAIAQIMMLPREGENHCVRVKDVMAILDPMAEKERQLDEETK